MNYADLFRVTLPETMLEAAALLVLLVDLGFLRKAALKTRVTVTALLGVLGCVAALWALQFRGSSDLSLTGDIVYGALLGVGGFVPVAQVGILVLTALTLLLFVDSLFTPHAGEYVAVVLMAASGGLLVAAARDLLVIFVGLEVMSLGLYILTAFNKECLQSAESALKYYMFGGMSAAFLLFGFSYFYGLSGTTNLIGIQAAVSAMGPSPLLYVAWVCVVVGLSFKIAAVPFHVWAPDAYQGAPAPAAAFIASVSKVASFTLLLTISWTWMRWTMPLIGSMRESEAEAQAFYAVWPKLAIVLFVVAAASMVIGNLAALAQRSVRRLLAFSAIAHAGYILPGIVTQAHFNGVGSPAMFAARTLRSSVLSTEAVLVYVLTYGLTVVAAFGVVGVVERRCGSDNLDAFLGLHKRNPLLAAVLLVCFLSLAGIPPLVGFWAKFNLFAAILQAGGGPIPFVLVALAVAMSCVSLYYYLQVLKRVYVMPVVDDTPISTHPLTMTVLLAITLAVVLLGCFPAAMQSWMASFR